MNTPTMRDRADVFHLDRPGAEKVTIDRPDRSREHCRTYALADLTPASRARLLRLIQGAPWVHRQRTPHGWMGYHLPTPRRTDD